jgi:DNA-binding response OmpR family regulator
MLRAAEPRAVLLDLDLPDQASWAAADLLLQETDCPPLLLLTARSQQFDVRTALRAGSLLDKTATPGGLLERAEGILAAPNPANAERNAIQRVLIQWLRPSDWPVLLTSAHRCWGVNE